MLLTGRMSFKRFGVYCLAQFLGSFVAACIVYFVYIDALQHYKAGMYSIDAAGNLLITSNEYSFIQEILY